MGIVNRLVNGFRRGVGNDYEAVVHEQLAKQFKLDRSSQWRLKAYDALIQEYKGKGVSPAQTALEVAVAYYVAQCLGDAADREDAGYLFISLKPAIHIAGLSGDISFDRAEQLGEIVKHSTQTAVFKDMEEGTGMFSKNDDTAADPNPPVE
jgi:hypothetical protein